MLDFIYDSLDTVKKLKFPTFHQVLKLTLGIFALVLIAGLYFVLVDTLFSDGYRSLYTALTGKEITPNHAPMPEQQIPGATELELTPSIVPSEEGLTENSSLETLELTPEVINTDASTINTEETLGAEIIPVAQETPTA